MSARTRFKRVKKQYLMEKSDNECRSARDKPRDLTPLGNLYGPV